MKFKKYLDLYEMANPLMVHDDEIKKFEKTLKTGDQKKSKLVDMLSNIYSKYEPTLSSVKNEFESKVKKEIRKFRDIKFLTDIKSIKSIIDKAILRKKGLLSINDLVRGALLMQTKSDADEFVKNFIRKNKNVVVGYEEKKRGQDNTYGYYGSHHLDLNLNGIIVELQVMTKKLWAYKEEAHKIYTANRSKIAQSVDKFDMFTSKKIFSLANIKEETLDEEFLNVLEVFSLQELEDMTYESWVEVDLTIND